MAEVPEAVAQAALRGDDERVRMGALLLVRYCSFHQNEKFSPWFERERQVLADIAGHAGALLETGGPRTNLTGLQDELKNVLEESDPDGPPFQAEVFDHLVFADEVIGFLLDPQDSVKLAQVLERADELAEVHEELGREGYDGSDWEPAELLSLEVRARTLDTGGDVHSAAALARSVGFARDYAQILEKCY